MEPMIHTTESETIVLDVRDVMFKVTRTYVTAHNVTTFFISPIDIRMAVDPSYWTLGTTTFDDTLSDLILHIVNTYFKD